MSRRCLHYRAGMLPSSKHDIIAVAPLSPCVRRAEAGAEAVTPACQLAAQLVAAWGELRQLEALLASLRATIAAGPAQPPLASVLRAPTFLATLTEVLPVTTNKQAHPEINKQHPRGPLLHFTRVRACTAFSGTCYMSNRLREAPKPASRSWGRCRQGRHLRWSALWRRGCRRCWMGMPRALSWARCGYFTAHAPSP